MIFFLLLLLLQTSHAFDYVYEKGNEQTFAYDSKRVCKILEHPPYRIVRLENVFDQFDRTAVKRLDIAATDRIVGCLNYKGYSYLFYITHNNSTTIIKGSASTLTFPILLDNLYYDHIHSTLYTIAEDSFLYQIQLETLHTLWNKEKEIEIDKKLNGPLPVNNITDAFVFNHTVYWLTFDGKVYKQSIGLNETTLVEADYPGTKFSIIPFSSESGKLSITITENPHIKISGLGTDSIFLPLPSSSLSTDFVFTTNNIFLYILDILFFLCLIIVLRIATRKKTKKEGAILKLLPDNLTA